MSACAAHLLDRIWVGLSEDRPYELRDVEGQAVTVEEARRIIAERCTVPPKVRRHNNHRRRQVWAWSKGGGETNEGKAPQLGKR